MIVIKNRQRTVQIDTDRLYREVAFVLHELSYDHYDLTIIITNDRTIRRFNKQYRSVDAATDILSFPYYADLVAGDRIIPITDDEHILGDIIISAPYVARAAQKYGVSIADRMQLLMVHGILHLLGYDHQEDVEYEHMQTEETRILRRLKKEL